MEVWLAGFDAVVQLGIVDVPASNDNIERQADAEIRAHGGVDRDQSYLQCIITVDVVGNGAVKYRFAVLVLTDLQIRGVGGAFEETARGVEHEKPRTFAFELASQQEGDIEF